MKRAALYVRVSTDEQKEFGISIDSQIDALQKYCAENDLYIMGIYNDAGYSARKKYTTRPALLKLLEDCKQKKVDCILFTRLDRWFRSVPDYHAVQAILDENKVYWRTIWEDYETETAAGVFKVNIMLAVSQSEADRTSERIKSVKEYQKAQGKFVGGLIPFGFVYDKPSGKLLIDEEMRSVIKGMFSTFLTTHNMIRVQEYIQEHAGRKFCKSNIRKMLKAEYYRGDYNGYKLEPYITQEQAKQIDIIFEQNKNRRSNEVREYIFSGLLECAICGKHFGGMPRTCYNNKDKSKIYHSKVYCCSTYKNNYGCKNTRAIAEGSIEKYLLNNIEGLIENENRKIKIRPKNKKNDFQTEYNKLNAKLKRIGLRFEDGDISVEEYREKRDAIRIEISELKMDDIEPSEVPALPNNWKDIYNSLDCEHKRIFWQKIIRKIVVGTNKNVPHQIFFM